MLEKILGALLPAVITILLGYFAARHHDFKQKEVPTLNKMVISYALPLSLFVGVVSAGRAQLLADLPLAIVLAIALIGTYAAVFLVCRIGFRYPAGFSALGALASSAPSSAFVGAAVLGYLYGAKADIPVAIGSILIVLALVPVTLIILSLQADEQPGRGDAASSDPDVAGKIVAALRQPVVWLPLCGFIVVLLGIPVPKVIQNSLSLLGHASAGVALFVSGIIIAGYRVVVNGPVLSFVLVKNIVQPGLVWGALLWFGYANPLLGEAVLTVALPSVVLAVMLSVQYKVATAEMASALLISTLGAIVTMSGFILLVD
ncbi:MAG: AEC family transporter [Methyloceanibacter sp.]|uniref:AEC family transporter n=1 Tax=Methyloceanibacter sp. TaxID=1965321 RepID=UPI003D6D18E7